MVDKISTNNQMKLACNRYGVEVLTATTYTTEVALSRRKQVKKKFVGRWRTSVSTTARAGIPHCLNRSAFARFTWHLN